MALHEKDKIKDNLLDDVYASSDLSVVMPKYKMPEKEHDPRHAYQVVHDELMLDGNARQNLATFVSTWAEPEVHKLMDECMDKNMIDKDEYPQTAEIEARCVHMLADLWNSPTAAGGTNHWKPRSERSPPPKAAWRSAAASPARTAWRAEEQHTVTRPTAWSA